MNPLFKQNIGRAVVLSIVLDMIKCLSKNRGENVPVWKTYKQKIVKNDMT